MPEVSKVLLLSRAFGVTADWLISDEGLPERKPEVENESPGQGPGERSDVPNLPNWVESVPGVLGRLIKRWGWLVGVHVAIVGAAFILFGVIARVLVGGFIGGVSGMMGGVTTPGFGFGQSVASMSSPFETFANIFIGLGVILIIAGIALALALRRYGNKK